MRRIVLAFAVLLIAASAATAGTPPAYFVDEAKLPFAALPGLATQRDWGVHNGAGYRIEVPENWNGAWSCGRTAIRGTGLELTVDNHPLRAFLSPTATRGRHRATAGTTTTRRRAPRTRTRWPPVQREVRQARTDVHHGGFDGWPRHRPSWPSSGRVVRRRDADLRRARRLRAVRLLPRLQRRGPGAVRRRRTVPLRGGLPELTVPATKARSGPRSRSC